MTATVTEKHISIGSRKVLATKGDKVKIIVQSEHECIVENKGKRFAIPKSKIEINLKS